MKARLFMFMALVLGLVSCQNEPDEMNVSLGGEQEVMLTVSLPEATRADSAVGALDNSVLTDYDLRYILEVYYGENCNRFVQTSTSTSAVFPVRLAPGRTYTFVVWADFVTKGADAEQDIDLFYETSAGLKAIQIIEDKWAPMVEARDAYVGSKTVADFQTSSNLEMTLTRPFAKVRVVSTDIEQLRGVGIVPTTAQATYSQNMYRKFNAATGVASDAATKTHTFAYADVDSYEANTDSKLTIFSDYIFVPAEGVAKFTLEVWDGETPARSIKQNNFNTDIFVEKNKVTSIVGDVLTTGGNVKVTIDGELGEKETITIVDNAQSLQDAINNAPDGEETIIELGGDIDLGSLTAGLLSVTRAGEPAYALLVDADKEVALDLKGFTISYEKTQTAAFSMIQNDGKLTIVDSSVAKTGKIVYADKGQGGEYVSNTIGNSGELIISGGTIENSSISAVAENGYPHVIDTNGELIINGGTLTNAANYSTIRIWTSNTDPEKCKVTINGGTFNGCIDFQSHNNNYSTIPHYGTLTVTGGTFNPDTYTKSAIRVLRFGVNSDDMHAKISGGRFYGKVAVRNYSSSNEIPNIFDICGGTFTTDAKAGTDEAFINDDYAWVEEANDFWTLVRKADVAMIGEVGYTSLAKAVAAVKDGETITLVANEVFTENNYYDNGGYKDGLGYAGDKSFTLDLGGNTISQDGYLNDYLLWFKNVGSKDNTITIKNGTLDAGTTAYSALCTSSANEHKITINIENINLVGNNSNGAVAKIRGGSELNVNAGTVITGKNNYVGIEAAGNNTVVNIYDNAKIYQNGTDSYVGAIVGASQNATMNIYGGYGKSAKCGIIVMSTGATINVSGGEWIANNDGTVANDNNAVLVSQNNRNESSWACKSILNVTGGTFKGGYNCYGMGPGVEPNDAQININGGNFNSNPANYVVAGYKVVEENGIWTVVQYTPFSELVEKVKAANGTYVGQGETYTIIPTSGDAREQGVAATVPNRLQKYSNPEVYYAQYQLFAELGDVNISNVKIEFIPAAITVKDAWNTAGATTTKDNVNGEVQFMNSGKVTLTDCVFNTVSVSPINAPQLAVSGCEFNELKAYAIKDVKAGVVNISNNEFNNCNGGFWFNAAPENVVANGNIFSVGRRGAIQFSATGDYTNSIIDIAGNVVEGALLWQLNETLPYQAYKTIIENNTYTTACVDGSIIPEPVVAKIGETEYSTLTAAIEAAESGATITLLEDVELAETVVIPEGKEIVLDLNGHNITSNIAGKPSESFELFSVNGNLEIKGNGTISLTSEDFEWNTSYRYTAINIREKGVVTLGNGVSVICEASKDGSYGMSYAVDIYTTGTLNINGASLHSNYIAVRCFYGNSVVYVNSGSKITSSRNNYGIWLQSSPGAVVTIADGVNYTFENNIYCFN